MNFSEKNYSVFDYCSRSTVQLISLTDSGDDIGIFKTVVPRNHNHLAQLILLHNHQAKSVEYTISFEKELVNSNTPYYPTLLLCKQTQPLIT